MICWAHSKKVIRDMCQMVTGFALAFLVKHPIIFSSTVFSILAVLVSLAYVIVASYRLAGSNEASLARSYAVYMLGLILGHIV